MGVTNGLAAVLPLVKKNPKTSAIVFTGSKQPLQLRRCKVNTENGTGKQGITNPPGNAAYNASKAAIKSLAESLSYDLRDTQTSVHLLVPGWTFTGLVGNDPDAEEPTPKPDGAWTAQQVAEYMHEEMGRKKFYIICPDNDTTEKMDNRRMRWAAEDVVQRRPPLTRWREEWKEKSEAWMQEEAEAGR